MKCLVRTVAGIEGALTDRCLREAEEIRGIVGPPINSTTPHSLDLLIRHGQLGDRKICARLVVPSDATIGQLSDWINMHLVVSRVKKISQLQHLYTGH